MSIKQTAAIVVAIAFSFFAATLISDYFVYDKASALFKTLDNGKGPIPFATLVSAMRWQGTVACFVTALISGIASAIVLFFFRRR